MNSCVICRRLGMGWRGVDFSFYRKPDGCGIGLGTNGAGSLGGYKISGPMA